MRATNRHLPNLIALSLAAALLAGCGPESEPGQPIESDELGTGEQALSAGNGLSLNGLNRNGLNRNGLNRNGLNRNGLSKLEFSTWFNEDAATSDQVMKYSYGCAASPGSTLTWTNPATTRVHTWAGALGLAQGWTGGTPATVAEQQAITACLAAHVNKYGLGVPIAVEGRTAIGTQIPISAGELSIFSWREACFFGNLFNGEGAFLAFDRPNWDPNTSSARGCAVDVNGVWVDCLPVVTTGEECRDICRADSTGTFWESCTWQRKTYKPLTTRIRPQEVYRCGDGICQVSEHCGTGTSAASCKDDCGLCP